MTVGMHSARNPHCGTEFAEQACNFSMRHAYAVIYAWFYYMESEAISCISAVFCVMHSIKTALCVNRLLTCLECV